MKRADCLRVCTKALCTIHKDNVQYRRYRNHPPFRLGYYRYLQSGMISYSRAFMLWTNAVTESWVQGQD
jgi:hypothetical protein